MATLALSVAGQFVGGFVGGPIGATIGRALGALAGAAVDNALFGEKPQRRAGSDFQLQGSLEGGAVPRLYGWGRVSGNIIWATELEEMTSEGSGAKGFGQQTSESEIFANFAVGLCEGEVHRLGRVWADGKLLDLNGLNVRFYRGTSGQGVDSLIEAKQGAGNAPAYRGLCYLVFERLPLSQFGNRIPQISVELCRVVGQLEPSIKAVTVIPGATEFGYDPVARVRVVGPGETAAENTHMAAGISDWTLSIDELVALCPNLEHVSLVVTWFGTDLRCAQCLIEPRVEGTGRVIEGTSWSVAGLTRATAGVVSTHEGGPAYGGTPSDAAVLAAIADLKARGLKVTLYPLVMMDIPQGNTLTDPYWGGYQPAYPWRGRVTCDPAPGSAGSPDRSGAVLDQVADFVGTGSDWRYRRMVTHYASLAASAGGVDAFIIGSEMRAMTTLRDASDGFPFATALVALAAEVRSIVGGATKLTYAADWSEFSGYQPDGEKFFHLDPLWASADIDAVGIDNYMPLTDWRDGDDHLDAAEADSLYEQDYLQSRIAGGEGYDWYYGSDGARVAQVRSPIGDGVYGEPWVWRFKDIEAWWSNAHHDRPGGVRSASTTSWVPQSKPIWFTELGCAAVDKGANQPNVFGDPKSSESGRPYFSSGLPDPLGQRQFLRAQLDYWGGAANPASSVYGGPMVARIYLWTWDARPYPAFPADTASWSDGANHATGHWLTGRTGAMASDELIAAVAADYGAELDLVQPVQPLIHGLRIEGLASAREALGEVLAVSGLSARDSAQGLQFRRGNARNAIAAGELVADDGPILSRRRPDPGEALGRVALTYFDRERAYLTGTVTALRLAGGAAGAEASNLVLDLAGARHAAERILLDRSAAAETLEFSLPPSMAAVEVGDVLMLEGVAEGPFEVTEIRDGLARKISARAMPPAMTAAITSDRPQASMALTGVKSMPIVLAAHLPPLPDAPLRSRLAFAASARPWPGDVTISDEVTGSTLARLSGATVLGELTADLPAGAFGDWDDLTTVRLRVYSGHFSSVSEAAVFGGSNRLAVQGNDGEWEILGFAAAELLAPGLYVLSHLLRGMDGSASGAAASGNALFVPDARAAVVPVDAAWLNTTLDLRAFAGRSDLTGQALAVPLTLAPVLPLAPVEPVASRALPSGDVTITWTRRSRGDPNGTGAGVPPLEYVPETYRVTVFDAGVPARVVTVSTTSFVYSSADQTSDFGALPADFAFEVAQVSAGYGPGHPAQGDFHA